eukprot:TRINITY_DN14585_c0_g1_i1.p1 TRINITY_DN14585_c0_g1~~TRINITY_DN14585_c0_g1_i1.p1  ORF type:complete len:517 (+),score=8.63 TRINITY_DN14585_c0_g1_i1:60-1610(+)
MVLLHRHPGVSTQGRCCLMANDAIKGGFDGAASEGGVAASAQTPVIRSAAAACYSFACFVKMLACDCLHVRLCNAGKLMTKEDLFHLHKLSAISCLVHYAYRILRLITTGTTGLQQDGKTPVYLALHVVLNLSSFLFNLPRSRVKGKPMIWPAYRLHVSIFAGRSIICILLHWLDPPYPCLLRGGVCLVAMKLADVVTEYHKDRNDGTTIRDLPYPAYMPEWVRKLHHLGHALAQGFATLLIFADTTPDYAFFILMVIQLTPFSLTLVKKSILQGAGAHLFFSCVLLFAGSLISFRWDIGASFYLHLSGYAAVAFLLRVGLCMNKYILWSLLIFACQFRQQNPIARSVFQARSAWRSSTPPDEYVVSLAARGDFVRLRALFAMHPGLVRAQCRSNGTVLHFAVAYRHMSFIQRCLQSGLPVDGFGSPSLPTPLTIAVRRNHHSAVKLLLRKGADPYLVVPTLRASKDVKVSSAVLDALLRYMDEHGDSDASSRAVLASMMQSVQDEVVEQKKTIEL